MRSWKRYEWAGRQFCELTLGGVPLRISLTCEHSITCPSYKTDTNHRYLRNVFTIICVCVHASKIPTRLKSPPPHKIVGIFKVQVAMSGGTWAAGWTAAGDSWLDDKKNNNNDITVVINIEWMCVERANVSCSRGGFYYFLVVLL